MAMFFASNIHSILSLLKFLLLRNTSIHWNFILLNLKLILFLSFYLFICKNLLTCISKVSLLAFINYQSLLVLCHISSKRIKLWILYQARKLWLLLAFKTNRYLMVRLFLVLSASQSGLLSLSKVPLAPLNFTKSQ